MSPTVDLDAFELKAPLGKFAYRDSGPVSENANYTTIVLIHGFGFHSASFALALAEAVKQSVRLIVLNRRDFPGSAPYSDDEHAQLNKALQGPPEETKKFYVPFMKERSKEFVEFLGALIEKEKIPCVDETGRGGIVLTSWSMGAFWLVPFLKDVASISEAAGVELQKYISRAVLYDAPALSLGIARPADPWGPLLDEDIPPENRLHAFSLWIGSYFDHASSPDGLERRKGLDHPPISTATNDPEINPRVMNVALASPGGSDWAHLFAPLMSGAADEDRNNVLFGDVAAAEKEGQAAKHWTSLPVRYIFCDHSIWESPWCVTKLNEQMAEERQEGKLTREITIKTLKGANHFAHWDMPEKFVEAIVAEQ